MKLLLRLGDIFLFYQKEKSCINCSVNIIKVFEVEPDSNFFKEIKNRYRGVKDRSELSKMNQTEPVQARSAERSNQNGKVLDK